MKSRYFIFIALSLLCILLLNTPEVMAQCSICSKVAASQSEGAAKGFNAGILYLAAVPFSVLGVIGYRWYKNNLDTEEDIAE